MRHRRLRPALVTAAGLLVAFAAPGAAHAATPAFMCEASAIRGTVLGQTVEPVVFGRGQACRTGSGKPVPGLAVPALLQADALVAAGTNTPDALKPSVSGAGGLANARVQILPSLPVKLPIEQAQAAIAAVGPITVPLTLATPLAPATSVQVNINDALTALLPNGGLPQTDLLSTSVLSSVAGASCDGGKLTLAGSSTVTGLKLLGRPIDLDSGVQRDVNVIDSSSIDPSKIDISKVTATVPGVTLPSPAVLQAALQPLLDAIPDIKIPAAVAQVKLTAGTQSKTATSLTQQALRVQASLLGTSLIDAVVGEARVTATGACPARGAVQPAELQCTDRKLVLLDVFREGRHVRLRGAANRNFVGKFVSIRFRASGAKTVARAKVAKDGSFTTTAPVPSVAVRDSNVARYTAVRSRERSLPLKLIRRMRTTSVTSKRGLVTIRGRISKPLANPTRSIRLIRRVACGKAQLVKTFKPKADGTFVVHVKASSRPAVYRLTTRVRKVASNPKTYPTFTLPRGIDLNQR